MRTTVGVLQKGLTRPGNRHHPTKSIPTVPSLLEIDTPPVYTAFPADMRFFISIIAVCNVNVDWKYHHNIYDMYDITIIMKLWAIFRGTSGFWVRTAHNATSALYVQV